MKKLLVRSTSALLVLLLLLSSLAACAAEPSEGTETTAAVTDAPATEAEKPSSENSAEPTDEPATNSPEDVPSGTDTEADATGGDVPSGTPNDTETDIPDESEEAPIYTEESTPPDAGTDADSPDDTDALPSPVDLDGYVYKAYVRSRGGSSGGAFWCEDFWIENDSTHPIYHAVYERNLEIESLYNCRIKQVDSTTATMYDEMKAFYLDGEKFELAIVLAMGAASCAVSGLLRDVSTLPNIQTSHPAYDQNILRDLRIGSRLYFLSGDMNISPTDAAAVTLFNPTLLKSYDFGALLGHAEYNDPYQLVMDGKWTVDTMLAMAAVVNNDADKSGGALDATAGDTVGYFQYSASALYYWYGCGARISEPDAQAIARLTYATEQAESVYDFLYERLNVAVKHPEVPVQSSGTRQSYYATGKTLFTDILLWDVRKSYHVNGYSYGILPIPKLETEQERYFNIVYYPYQTVHLWMIPKVCQDSDKASLLLHVMAVFSKPVMNGYFKATLHPVELESSMAIKTLQTVKESLTYDLALLYDWGGFFTGTLGKISSAEENGYSDAVSDAAWNEANEEMLSTLQGFLSEDPLKNSADGLCFLLQENGKAYTVFGCTDKERTEVVIPSSFEGLPVTGIEEKAFSGMEKLTRVSLPDSITSIERYTFQGCTALRSITIPDGVTSIADSTFLGCTALGSITIPDSITSIGSSAFRGCTALGGITIPDGVTSIGEYAFRGCTALGSITIPDSVTRIGRYAFSDCTSLSSVVFENREGWVLHANYSQGIITPPQDLADILADPERAAVFLSDTYDGYTWKVE